MLFPLNMPCIVACRCHYRVNLVYCISGFVCAWSWMDICFEGETMHVSNLFSHIDHPWTKCAYVRCVWLLLITSKGVLSTLSPSHFYRWSLTHWEQCTVYNNERSANGSRTDNRMWTGYPHQVFPLSSFLWMSCLFSSRCSLPFSNNLWWAVRKSNIRHKIVWETRTTHSTDTNRKRFARFHWVSRLVHFFLPLWI